MHVTRKFVFNIIELWNIRSVIMYINNKNETSGNMILLQPLLLKANSIFVRLNIFSSCCFKFSLKAMLSQKQTVLNWNVSLILEKRNNIYRNCFLPMLIRSTRNRFFANQQEWSAFRCYRGDSSRHLIWLRSCTRL